MKETQIVDLTKIVNSMLTSNSEKELAKARKNLSNLASKSWVRESALKLANRSLEFLYQEFDENNMSNHKKNLSKQAAGQNYKAGFIISANNDDVIMFNEFGTGIVGEGTGVLADLYGYEYNVGLKRGIVPEGAVTSYAKTYGVSEEEAREILELETTPNTWWYFKNKKWHRTEGMRGKNMFANLQMYLLEDAKKTYILDINDKLRRL